MAKVDYMPQFKLRHCQLHAVNLMMKWYQEIRGKDLQKSVHGLGQFHE